MQRRVAAIYFAFFLVMAMSAYSVIAVAEEPTVDVAGEQLAQGDTITVNGQEYTVDSIGEQGEENASVGQLATTNDSAVYSAELANGSVLAPTNSSWPGRAATFSATSRTSRTAAAAPRSGSTFPRDVRPRPRPTTDPAALCLRSSGRCTRAGGFCLR